MAGGGGGDGGSWQAAGGGGLGERREGYAWGETWREAGGLPGPRGRAPCRWW